MDNDNDNDVKDITKASSINNHIRRLSEKKIKKIVAVDTMTTTDVSTSTVASDNYRTNNQQSDNLERRIRNSNAMSERERRKMQREKKQQQQRQQQAEPSNLSNAEASRQQEQQLHSEYSPPDTNLSGAVLPQRERRKTQQQQQKVKPPRRDTTTPQAIAGGNAAVMAVREQRKQRKLNQSHDNEQRQPNTDPTKSDDDNGQSNNNNDSVLPGAFSVTTNRVVQTDNDVAHSPNNMADTVFARTVPQPHHIVTVPHAELVEQQQEERNKEEANPLVAAQVEKEPRAPLINFTDKRVRLFVCAIILVVCVLIIGIVTSLTLSQRGARNYGSSYDNNNNDDNTNYNFPPTTNQTAAPSNEVTEESTEIPVWWLNWFPSATFSNQDDEEFGHSIQLSSSGEHLIVGAPLGGSTPDGDGPGFVRVYRNYLGEEWEMLGPTIFGEEDGNGLGYSVALSDSGRTIAASAIPINVDKNCSIRVYQYNDTHDIWNLKGTIAHETMMTTSSTSSNPKEASFWIGEQLSLSNDGKFVGTIQRRMDDHYSHDHSFVLVYALGQNDTWHLSLNVTGDSLSLKSLDATGIAYAVVGNVLSEEASRNNENHDSATVTVYAYDELGNDFPWIQVGQTLTGTSNSRFGDSVVLSNDAKHIIIGSPTADAMNDTITNAGSVIVYQYNETTNTWLQFGNENFGFVEDEQFGTQVAISGDGQRYMVYSPSLGISPWTGMDDGISIVSCYQYLPQENLWVLLGGVLSAEVGGEEFGFSVSISDQGDRIAVSAPARNKRSIGSGYVKIYDLDLDSFGDSDMSFETGEAERIVDSHSSSCHQSLPWLLFLSWSLALTLLSSGWLRSFY